MMIELDLRGCDTFDEDDIRDEIYSLIEGVSSITVFLPTNVMAHRLLRLVSSVCNGLPLPLSEKINWVYDKNS